MREQGFVNGDPDGKCTVYDMRGRVVQEMTYKAGRLNGTMTMFGHMPPENWREIMPYVRHIHGKFYHVNEDGIEPSIPYPRLMQVLLDASYSGTISAEWEGHSYTREPMALGEVKAWRRMCNRLLTLD